MKAYTLFKIWLTNYYPPTTKWVPDRDMPDLSGKVVIVTGGNTGIGKETVKALLKKNAKVYMASRSRARAEEAIADLKRETGKEAIFLELDLANLDKVATAAKEFMNKEPALHILFNQGGVMTPPIEAITEDGYDLQFGTNVLGHAHFTLCLLPALEAGAQSGEKARIIHTSSFAVYIQTPAKIDFETLKDGPKRRKVKKEILYAQSKYGNVALSNELARRWADKGITSNAVNPGNIMSDLWRHTSTPVYTMMRWFFLRPTPMGAITQLYVGTSPEAKDANGKWFIPWAREVPHDMWTRNPEVEQELWDWIEKERTGHY